jgi:uncharacterized protein (TIGR00645 family)
MHPPFNTILRTFLLASRWGMAPLCLGLVAALLLVLAQFFRELAQVVIAFPAMDGAGVMLAVLKLIDLVLVANLVVMIIAAGVEIFLPTPAALDEERLDGTRTVDFARLKLRLFASNSAIAAIDLLESFINIGPADKSGVLWEIAMMLAFVVSGVLLALMDRLAVGRR